MPDSAGRFKGRCHFSLWVWVNMNNLFLIFGFLIFLVIFLICCWEYILVVHSTQFERYEKDIGKKKDNFPLRIHQGPSLPSWRQLLFPSQCNLHRNMCMYVCSHLYIKGIMPYYAVLYLLFFSLT